jgi:F-type H+-transporting ATPase subunit b
MFIEAAHAATEAAAIEASGPASPLATFGVNWMLFAAQLVNFSIVIFVLAKWVFKPLMKTMDERKAKIETGLKEAADAKVRLASAESERERLVRGAHLVARDIVDKSKTKAEEEHEKRVQASKQIVEEHLREAKARAEREADDAKRAAMKRVSEIVIAAAEKVTNNAIDADAHRKLISEAISELNTQTS